MANDTTGNPWILDTIGLIADHPVCVRKLEFFPNGGGDAVTIYDYDPSTALSSADAATTTVSSSSAIAATGKFTSAKAEAYGVINLDGRCKTGAGAASANINTKHMISARDNDNQVTVTPADLTDESSASYYFQVYAPENKIYMKASGTEVCTEVFEAPGTGKRMRNFILAAIGTSGKLHVHI